jgi:tetratricopeptide (TPR) repeat protein
VKQDPKAAEAYEVMGLSLVRQRRLRDELPLLARAAQLRDDVPCYAYVYAVALHEAGERQRALEMLKSAHARQPAYRDILFALVEYDLDAGDREAAATWARKRVQLSPGDDGARRLLQELEKQKSAP